MMYIEPIHFPGNTFTQAKKLKFGWYKFSRRTVCNSQTEIRFLKNQSDQVGEIIDHLYYLCKRHIVSKNS